MKSEDQGPVSTVCTTYQRGSSTDAIVPKDEIELASVPQVYQHTTITVTREPAY